MIPPCFAVASEHDKMGLGAIIPNVKCKAILYSPINEYTTKIMKEVMTKVRLTDDDMMGLDSIE